jgi:DNA-binding NtrC family response regulator
MKFHASSNYDRDHYILIVDDDQTLLKFFKIHLNRFFSKVIVVCSAKEALGVCQEKTIDLVITDIVMHKVTGLQLLTKLTRLFPTVPVLLISGASLTPEEELFCEEKTYGILKKPFSVDQLHEYIYGGLLKREKLKQLLEIIGSEKRLKALLQGKMILKNTVSKDDYIHAEQVWNELNRAMIIS